MTRTKSLMRGGPETTYAYNADGLLTSQTDALGFSTVYAYNSRNWLTSVTAPDPDGSGPLTASVITYGYDAAGERTTVTDALGNVTTTAYDADGRVTSVTAPDPDGSGPLSAPVTSYSYDNLGRETAITDPKNNTTDLSYNSLNQLVSKTDALGNITSYTLDALGDILTVTAVNWYFTDNQGTVRDIAQYNAGTNTTSVVDHLKFDSFGNITAQSNSSNQPLFAYTGQMFDSSTGLYWYHARWYDPHTGRFISQCLSSGSQTRHSAVSYPRLVLPRNPRAHTIPHAAGRVALLLASD